MAEHQGHAEPGAYRGPGPGGYGRGAAAPAGGFGAPAGGFAAAGPGAGAPLAADPGPVRLRTGPWPWVLAATAAAVAGLALAIAAPLAAAPTDPAWPALALPGWALGGIGTFVLLGAHLVADTRRQAAGPYVSTPAQTVLYRVAAAGGLLTVAATAIEIALWVSKTGVL